MFGRGGCEHVHGIRDARRGWQKSAQRRRRLGGECGQLEPLRLAGVGGEDAWAARVGHDRDPAARGHRLVREQGGDVEELLERARPDDAGLPEEGVHDGVAFGKRACVGGGCACAGPRAPGLDGDDRFASGDAARDA